MSKFLRSKVDPKRLSTISKNISENISQIETAIKQVKTTLSGSGGKTLSATWTGPASTQFYAQYNADLEIFDSYVKMLRTLNDQLSDAAGAFDGADRRVRDLINRLKIG
jgi:WXG100 family type VII secretion target